MANSGHNTKTIVIDFKILPSDAVKTIQDTRVKIENLKKTLEGMKAAGKENTETYIKLQAALKDMESVVRANQKVLVDSIKQQKSNADSLNAMRAQLRELKTEYENLSAAERDSAEGRNMIEKIAELNKEVSGLEQSMGDFSRNVGRYWSALEGFPGGKLILMFKQLSNGTMSLSAAFKSGVSAVKAFGAQLLKLLANPIVAAIAAIAAVVTKLTQEFKKNDEAMTALKSLFAAFKPIIDVVNKAFGALVDVLAKAINGISNFIQKTVSLIPSLKKYAQAEEDIVRSTDKLEESERQHALAKSEREKEISELRNKSVQSDKYSFKVRKKFLEQALKLEEENLKDTRDDAVERLRIAEKEAALKIGLAELTAEAYDKLDDDTKNRLNELKIAANNAETAFNDGTRRMQSQMSSFTKQEMNERKQRAQQAAQERKERLKNEREAYKELENIMVNGLKDLQSKEIAQLKASTRQQIAQIKERLETEKNLTAKAKEYLNNQIVLLEADLQIKIGDAQEKYRQERWTKELNETKAHYQRLLQNLTTEEARVAIKLEINKMDSQQLKDELAKQVKAAEDIVNQAMLDLNGDFEKGISSLDYELLAVKYGSVWEEMGITTGDNITKMNAMIKKWQDDLLVEQVKYNNAVIEIDKATANEELRIKQESLDKQWDLEKKHKEMLLKLEETKEFDAYGKNEIAKTQLLQQQAEERLSIVQNEYARLALMREKYNEQELAAMFGSVEAYNNALLEAEVGVVEAENNVANAIKNVNVAAAKQKATMINTATAVMSAMESVAGSIGTLFDTLAESDEKYEGWALAMAEMQILISTAISIAQAIQGAVTAGAATGVAAPFTTPVFIAEMVAIVVGAIANATTTLLKAKSKQTSAPKFAGGGLVGNKTTRRKDDTVDAKLTLGEYVIPAPVVDDLGVDFFDKLTKSKAKDIRSGSLRFAEGGIVKPQLPDVSAMTDTFDWDMMREVMADAVSEIQPVVSVKEITNKQNRVKVKESIAKQ